MGNHFEFYFEVLHVPKHSSPQEIRTAYRALVKKWHPDKHPPSSRPEAEAKFKAISEAYKVIIDQQDNRAMVGAESPRHRSQELQRPRRTSSSGWEFKDAYCWTKAAKAGILVVPRSNQNEAAVCREEAWMHARGALPRLQEGRQVHEGHRHQQWVYSLLCEFVLICRGIAVLIVGKEETQTIWIKPGWKKGTKITFEGKGDERPGCFPADIVFVISEKEHPIFKRVGNDLVLKAEVPLVNALTGWSFSFRLPTGEKMNCSFQDEIIYPEYEKRCKGGKGTLTACRTVPHSKNSVLSAL
ncbi:hypothetical protein GW17_00036661 [Ensete ventricosum]|nr:hypothetical protein GW17_00036661 [Ensete ventricosum]